MESRLHGPSGWALHGIAVLILLFVIAPLAVPVALSFSDTMFVTFPPQGFTLRWYQRVLTNQEFLTTFAFSLRLAVVVTALTLLIGSPCAFALVRHRFPGRGLVLGLVLSPLIFPVLVTGMALLQFFSYTAWNDAFWHLVIGHTIVCIPYVVRTVSASLLLADPNLEDAARTLGADPWRVFWNVTRPQIKPGLMAGSVFAFITSFDDYPVSMWLADAANFPLPLQIYVFIQRFFDPSVAAISTLMILFAVVLILITERLMGLSLRRLMTA